MEAGDCMRCVRLPGCLFLERATNFSGLRGTEAAAGKSRLRAAFIEASRGPGNIRKFAPAKCDDASSSGASLNRNLRVTGLPQGIPRLPAIRVEPPVRQFLPDANPKSKSGKQAACRFGCGTSRYFELRSPTRRPGASAFASVSVARRQFRCRNWQ